MNSPTTLTSIKNLHQVVEHHHKEKQRHLEMLTNMGKQLSELRAEREAYIRELAKTRKELAETKAQNAQLTKTVAELRQEVQVMVAAIDMANMEISDADNTLMDVATTIYSEFKSATPKAPVKSVPAAKQVAPTANPSSAQPSVLNFGQAPLQIPTAPHRSSSPQQNEMSSDMLDKGFKEIERLLSEKL